MPGSFQVFVSHDSHDEALALILKELIEAVFPSVDAFVSGNDLRGGALWSSELRDRLNEAGVIVALVTKVSQQNLWLYFEAGAGLIGAKTIPLCTDGVTKSSLGSPLSLLQARDFNLDDTARLLSDIARFAQNRDPSQDNPTIDRIAAAVQRAEQFIKERDQAGRTGTITSIRQEVLVEGRLPIELMLGRAEMNEAQYGYMPVFVPVTLVNNSPRGFTVTNLEWNWHPDEVLVAPMSMHIEADGNPCFGFTAPSGQNVHITRPAADAWNFPRDIEAGESLESTAALAVHPNLESKPQIQQDGFSLSIKALDARGQVLGKIDGKIRLG